MSEKRYECSLQLNLCERIKLFNKAEEVEKTSALHITSNKGISSNLYCEKLFNLCNADPTFSQAAGTDSLLSHIDNFQVKKSHVMHKLKYIVNLENTIFRNTSGVALERVYIL